MQLDLLVSEMFLNQLHDLAVPYEEREHDQSKRPHERELHQPQAPGQDHRECHEQV